MSDLTEYANLINSQTQLNNSWSAEQALKQMQFQERLSNTAHQREVADLKAAGLNPVLSASSNGASSPTGAMGSTDTSGVAAITDIAVQLAKAQSASALAAARASASYDNSYYSKDPFARMIEDVVEGYTGTSAKQALNNLGSWLNSSGTVQKATAAAKNILTSAAGSGKQLVNAVKTVASKVWNSKIVQKLLK